MMPQQVPQASPSPQSNPQLFMQLLQQMGYGKPNMMPPQGPPQQGMPPQGAPPGGMPPQQTRPPMPPQMPPQGAGQMAPGQMQGQQAPLPQPQQMMQGQQGANPQMQQMLMQMMQQRMQQRMQQGGAPGQSLQGQPPQQGQQGQQGQSKFTPQELGALGRLGDTTIAHLTPGEITIPPQLQSPKVLATIDKEYHKKHVDPSQFTVGSPNSSINPRTGVPEYNFWSSFLPIAGGLAGSIFAPELLPALGLSGAMSGLTASAIGGGLGTTVGGLAGGQDPLTAGLTGLGSGLGGYALGNLLSPAAAGGSDAVNGASATAKLNPVSGGLDTSALTQQNAFGNAISGAQNLNPGAYGNLAPAQQVAQDVSAEAPSAASNSSWFSKLLPQNSGDIGQTIGSAGGGALGGMLAQGILNPANSSTQPTGFNSPYKPASQLPNWQTQIGQTGYTGPTPQFTGYNPATNYPASYNFFPTGQQNAATPPQG